MKGVWLGIKSPPVTGLRGNANYVVSVRIFADKTKKTLLGTHEQRFLCDQGMLDFARRRQKKP